MGSVWRADRPQKGRFRQFTQCDIDIFGDPTSLAEIELILATTTALSKICPDNAFTVRINDRGILFGMARYCGFAEEAMDSVLITLDKMDKIGFEGVEKELLENGNALHTLPICNALKGLGRFAALFANNGTTAMSGHNADRCLPDHFLPLQSLNSALEKYNE